MYLVTKKMPYVTIPRSYIKETYASAIQFYEDME